MSLTIREYAPSDEPALRKLVTGLIDLMSTIDPLKLFRPEEEFDAKKNVEMLVPSAMKNGKIILAVLDDEPVGYLVASMQEQSPINATYKFPHKVGVIDSLVISEEHRKKGISTALVAHIEDYFRQQGCTHCEVGALAVNEPAKAFYRKQGYHEQYIDFMKKL